MARRDGAPLPGLRIALADRRRGLPYGLAGHRGRLGRAPWPGPGGVPEELLHQQVDGEWSFVQTLRHLLFATDAWIRRALLGDPSPYHPLDLPHDEMGDIEGVPNDRDARPSLDEVLALRADRMATVRQVIVDLTDEDLSRETTPVPEVGYPASEAYLVSRCVGAILNEEWWHRRFAERDLAVLESQHS